MVSTTDPHLPTDLALTETLASYWEYLLEAEGVDPRAGAEIFHLVCGKYSEPHRFYHNLNHIYALLRLVDEYRAELQQPNVVEWAIWFHDVIYDTKRKDNEARSADLAVESLKKLGIADETSQPVAALIRATQAHQAENLPPDGRFFLDFDLSVLGARADLYQQYSQWIRAEYAWVLGFFYRRGRKKILRSFLNRETLYFTPQLRDRFEAQARGNLAAEIRLL